MFSRLDQGAVPPAKVEQFVSFMTDQVIPELRKLHGYRSTVVGVDRSAGTLAVTTSWESAADREASDSVLAAVLRNAGRLELRPERIVLYEEAASDFVSVGR
jgi:hypothetical protein